MPTAAVNPIGCPLAHGGAEPFWLPNATSASVSVLYGESLTVSASYASAKLPVSDWTTAGAAPEQYSKVKLMDIYSALTAAVRRVQSTTLAFITSGLILLAVAFIDLTVSKSQNTVPFYVFISISAILILVGVFTEFRTHGQPQRRREQQPVKSDRQRLEAILEEAEVTLRHLESKAAGIPVTERTVSLSRDLESQRVLVEDLKSRLNTA